MPHGPRFPLLLSTLGEGRPPCRPRHIAAPLPSRPTLLTLSPILERMSRRKSTEKYRSTEGRAGCGWLRPLPIGACRWGASSKGIGPSRGSARFPRLPPTPILMVRPRSVGTPDGAVAALRAHCGGSDPDKKALTAQRKPPAGEGRWSAEGTRQHPSSSPASSIPDRTPQRGCCCSARPEEISTIEQPARGILALSDIVPHARAIPRYDFSAIAQAQGVPSAAQFHGWFSTRAHTYSSNLE